MTHCANKTCTVYAKNMSITASFMGSYRNKSFATTVCSVECKHIFETKYRCQLCFNMNETFINGINVCEGMDYDYIHGLSCEQLYTGIYSCNTCHETKNISHSACFYTDDEGRQVDDTSVQYYCFECTSSSTHNNLNNKAFNRI